MASAEPSTTGKKRRRDSDSSAIIVARQTNMNEAIHSRDMRQASALLSPTENIRIFAMRRPKPQCTITENWLIINVTSTSKEKWCLDLSPFFLGPIELYTNPKTGERYMSRNMENAWQFCKVYPQFINDDGQSPSDAYWKWAENGWHDEKPRRFPLGRRAVKPLYSLWNDQRLDYIQARKQIYAPLYAKYVEQTDGYKKLTDIYNRYCCAAENSKERRPMALLDFDGWDHLGQGFQLEQIINMAKPKMGHAFVLAGLLENNLFWLTEPEKSRVEQSRRTGLLLKDI